MSDPAVMVSVVVIGRNEGARLERCLRSVAEIDCGSFGTELLYIDSASTDKSVEVADAEGATTVVLTAAHPTAALARNAGWRLARGRFVLFLDGDTVLDPQFVIKSLPAFESKTAVVWGHRRELFPLASVYHRVLDLDWVYAPGQTAFCGGDALFRREVLEKTDGFDANLIAGEEPELCHRILELGYSVLHVDRPMTSHDLSITRLSQYWRRANRAGHAFAEVSDRFGSSATPFWRRESRRNQVQAVTLALSLVSTLLASFFFANLWLIVFAAGGFLLLIIRTSWRARWKTQNWASLLLYGLHSHLQQFPIYLGQLQYWRDRQQGRSRRLIEYKKS